MDLKRTWLTMLVFLLVSVLIWVGFSVYFSVSNVNINPNAQSYTQLLVPSFDSTTLDEIIRRVELLPVAPDSFKNLVSGGSGGS
ncbi:hypothetical protein IT417_00595 [bacterium]|nr:hypothetical protein [bacterium]